MRVTVFFFVQRKRASEAFASNVGFYNAEYKIKTWDL
jgi:hypothetical protein